MVECYGGEHEQESPFRHRIRGSRLGDFKVEMDASLLGDERYVDILRSLGVPVEGSWMQELLTAVGIEVETQRLRARIDELLEGVAGGVVPYEIVTPPIPIDALEELDAVIDGLRRLGAEGTSASLLHAFGLHLNPEIPRLDAATLLSHLRAGILLYQWITWTGDIDLNRRLSPYIDTFPNDYLRLVMQPDYAPDLDRFTDDYLQANPTRNRWLDLLPLLATHDRERVEHAASDPHLIGARPTFHYRLPNSMIDDPNWSLATEWNRWVQIERLAASPDWLRAMCEDYSKVLDASFSLNRDNWLRRSARWLEARLFAG